MDNFDLRTFLAEGKLHEAMFDVATTKRIAQQVADAFTAEDSNDLDLKYVVSPGVEAGHFDLDVEAGPNTPGEDWKDENGFGISNYLGQYAGGSFLIRDGIVINAAMRSAPVAKVSPEGEIEMISAEESRAAIGMEENKEETKSNKMKKSELKEMIKAAFLNEKETFDQAFDRIDKEKEVYPGSDKDDVKEAEDVNMIPAEKLFALIARDLEFSPLVQDNVMLSKKDAIEIMRHVIAIEGSDISAEAALGEYIASGDLNEAEEEDIPKNTQDPKSQPGYISEEDETEDVEVDAEEIDVDTDAETADAGEVDVEADAEVEMTGDKKEVQDNLQAALEAAKGLGDQKLVDQIGNSITFFTRTHVVGKGEVAEANIDVEVNSPVEDAEVGMDLEEAEGDKYFQIHVANSKGEYHPLVGSVFPSPEAADEFIKKVKGTFPKGIKKLPATPEDLKVAETQLNESVNRMKKLAGLIK